MVGGRGVASIALAMLAAGCSWLRARHGAGSVKPGQLWFDAFGPVGVPAAATGLAEVGWHVNVVLARLSGMWKLVEVGNVYP